MADIKQVISILDSYGVPHWTTGNNVSPGWVNIKCPFCNDPSNHLGILPETLKISCWRCSKKGIFYTALREVTGITRAEYDILTQEQYKVNFKHNALTQVKSIMERKKVAIVKEEKVIRRIIMPDASVPITKVTYSPLLHHYLTKVRKNPISLDTVIKHHCALCTHGPFMNRMIIPVYLERKLIAFQAADLTGKAILKYKTEGDINSTLYGIDDIHEHKLIVVTEGILDAWRLDKNVVCSFGTHLTDEQKILIVHKKPKTLIFAWDADAYFKARKVMGFFKPFVDKVAAVKFPGDEDPDSFGHDNSWKLIEKEIAK
jgi:hypothetical protein